MKDHDIVIAGVGMTSWGKYPGKTAFDLGVDAIFAALDNASLKWPDIKGLACSQAIYEGTQGLLAANLFSSRMGDTGIPAQNIMNGCAVGGSTLRAAVSMLLTGECDITMALGAEVSPEGFFPGPESGPEDMDSRRWKMVGISNPGYWGLECRRRMVENGTTEEHLAMAKVAASKHGVFNPRARYQKEYTVEEVLQSPMVCDPLRLFEICATSDGAAAVIVTTQKTAKKLGIKNPIKLLGVSLSTPKHGDPTLRPVCLSSSANSTINALPDVENAAKKAYEMSGVGPEDIDFIEVPDNSSWHYLTYPEIMGFYKPGDMDRALMDGETVLGGKLPICPSGGASSLGECIGSQGLFQVVELVEQLRGQSGPRQVANARTGMSIAYGVHGQTAAVVCQK
ncbi:MAG: transporter [Deltaproteobacteria bacterium]|nr:transporter [Deltaproteobacteria bacterium]